MIIVYFMNEHNPFILVPHFDILKPFLFRINNKAHLLRFLNYFKIIEYILILIYPHLLHDNFFLILHHPVYSFIIDLNTITGDNIYGLLNQGISNLFCMWWSIDNHKRRHYTITEILFELLLDYVLVLSPFWFLCLDLF